MSRVFALGLDGVGPDVWTRLRERDWLPTLGPLFGCVGPLRSTVPPLTAPAWTSIATGLNPGRHGVLDFWTRPRPGRPRALIGNSAARTFWEIASAQGFGVGVFNYPLSYPPRPVNGFWVSGMNTPRGVTDFATPASLAARLADFSPDIAADIVSKRDLRHRPDDRVALLRDLITLQANHLETGLIALRESDPHALQLFVFALTTTDRFLHFFWDCVAPSASSSDGSQPSALMDLARRFWTDLDRGVARWLDLAGADVALLFSDHGFGAYPSGVFNVPVWLRSVEWGSGAFRPPPPLSPGQRGVAALKDVLKRAIPSGLWERFRAWASAGPGREDDRPFKAETLYGQVIGLTLASHVAAGARPELIAAALAAARQSRDSAGAPVFSWAEAGPAVWPGMPDDFPDVVLCLRGDLGAGASAADPRLVFPSVSERIGDHTPAGVFGSSEPWLLAQDPALCVWDVSMIALHGLGAAMPDDVDGRLPDWMPGERLYASFDGGAAQAPAGYSADQSAEVNERLKMLGYVD